MLVVLGRLVVLVISLPSLVVVAWLLLLLLLVLWIQSIDIDLTRDSDLTTTQLGRSQWLAFVFVVLDRSMVVINHPPSILVVFGVLDGSWWPFSCLVVFGLFLADPILPNEFQRLLVAFWSWR